MTTLYGQLLPAQRGPVAASLAVTVLLIKRMVLASRPSGDHFKTHVGAKNGNDSILIMEALVFKLLCQGGQSLRRRTPAVRRGVTPTLASIRVRAGSLCHDESVI